LAPLHATVRLFVNFFQHSFKLARKAHEARGRASALIARQRPIKGCWQIRGFRTGSQPSAGLHAILDPVRLLSEKGLCCSGSPTSPVAPFVPTPILGLRYAAKGRRCAAVSFS
jgi:hypothetical protein